MLQRLLEFGVNEKFFEIKSLGKLDKSCCTNSKLEVIDYDNTKEKISAFARLQLPKSVDALKILPQLNRVDFIELKGFKQFIHHNNTNQESFDEKISHQIEKFDLLKKIKDSLFIFYILINHEDFKCTKLENDKFNRTEKNYIIVIDIDLYKNPANYRLGAYAYLRGDGSNKTDTIKRMILDKLSQTVDNILPSNLENLNRAKLLSCKQVDSYYKNLEEVRH